VLAASQVGVEWKAEKVQGPRITAQERRGSEAQDGIHGTDAGNGNGIVSVVWSCGGGTQSAAIAALIVQGKLPKPDLSAISDTGREASQTWRYFELVLKPELAKVGVELHRLPHSFDGTGLNTVDLYSGADGDTVLMPMFTDISGEIGQTSKFCSNEWKSRPLERFYKSKGFTAGEIWIGFSIDELQRMRGFDPRQKWNHAYPLVDLRMTRGDCIALVERMGWPTPPRSSCWMCPYRSDSEWKHLKATDPEDFEMAVALEKEIQTKDPNLYFHRSAKPLAEANLGDDEPSLDLPCASGMCFT
jgi:hypothetical protein